jgi:hypothetical protein
MEYTKDAPVAIWAANDTPADLPGCSAEWYVTDENGAVVTSGKKSATLPADGVLRIEGLSSAFPPEGATPSPAADPTPAGAESLRTIIQMCCED